LNQSVNSISRVFFLKDIEYAPFGLDHFHYDHFG